MPANPGDLIFGDLQYEYNGWLGGLGTDFVVNVEGLHTMPDLESSDASRGDESGVYLGRDTLRARHLILDIKVFDTMPEVDPVVDLLNAVFAIQEEGEGLPFVYDRPGIAKRQTLARPRRSSFKALGGYIAGAVDLICGDPRLYSHAEKVTTVTIPDASNTATAEAWNVGNVGMYSVLEIDGPFTNPRISCLEDNNRQVRLGGAPLPDLVVAAGQTLIYDTLRETLTIAGVDNYRVVRSDSQRFALKPGKNTITYQRSGAGAASGLRLRHRDAWR